MMRSLLRAVRADIVTVGATLFWCFNVWQLRSLAQQMVVRVSTSYAGVHRAGPQLSSSRPESSYQIPIKCSRFCDVARNGVEELGKMNVKWRLKG